MRLAVGDPDGNVLGIVDVDGSQWVMTDDGFKNTGVIYVPVTRLGTMDRVAFTTMAGDLIDWQSPLDASRRRQVAPHDTVAFSKHSIVISAIVLARAAERIGDGIPKLSTPEGAPKLSYLSRLLSGSK